MPSLAAQFRRDLDALMGARGFDPLGRKGFAEVTVRKIRGGRIAWVNWPLLRSLGFALPSRVPAPELEAHLLDVFAWRMVEAKGETPGLLGRATQTFYADRYGGEGPMPNLGSGRAAGRGRIQIKGIGPTPLVHANANYGHRNGGLRLAEALREAVWSELDHCEAPFGSNRVLAVIDCGFSMVAPSDGSMVRRGLLVRLFPLRPAHFMPNGSDWANPERLRKQQSRIAPWLPQPRVRPRGVHRLRSGLTELVERVASQHATLAARGIPHGSLNTSNIEMTGKLVDFGSQSAQPGHGPTRGFPIFNSRSSPTVPESLFLLHVALALGASKAMARHIPVESEVFRTFRLRHGRVVLERLLELTGFTNFGEAPSALAWELAFAIHALAFDKAEMVDIYQGTHQWTGAYDVGALLYCLACLRHEPPKNALRRLLGSRRDPAVENVVKAYFAMHEESNASGSAEIDDLIVRLAATRTQPRPQMQQSALRIRYERLTALCLANDDYKQLADGVDDGIETGRRFFDSPARQQVVIREWLDRSSAGKAWARYSYYFGRGYRFEAQAQDEAGSLCFFGDVQAGPPSAVLRLTTFEGDTSTVTAKMKLGATAGHVEVDLPANVARVNVRFATRVKSFELLPPRYTRGVKQFMQSVEMNEVVRPPGLHRSKNGRPPRR